MAKEDDSRSSISGWQGNKDWDLPFPRIVRHDKVTECPDGDHPNKRVIVASLTGDSRDSHKKQKKTLHCFHRERRVPGARPGAYQRFASLDVLHGG